MILSQDTIIKVKMEILYTEIWEVKMGSLDNGAKIECLDNGVEFVGTLFVVVFM